MKTSGDAWSEEAEVVCLGGGNGSPLLLRALKEHLPGVPMAAVVASTDNGRSTGMVRRALNMAAPGDLRHCLTTLASGRSPWAAVLEQRISAPDHPELDGIAAGNIVLAAFAQELGNLGAAGLEMVRLLGLDVPVYLVSVENAHLAAELDDGSTVHGELAVRGLGKPRIRQVFIEGEREGVWQPARRALENASTIIIGPGSLWTSLAATLSVSGVREAIAPATRVIFVCNTTTQSGQTDGLDISEHVEVIARCLGRPPDVTVLNEDEPEPDLIEALDRDGLHFLRLTDDAKRSVELLGSTVIATPLLAAGRGRPALWRKQDTAYHDMDRTVDALIPMLSLPLRVA